ISDTAFYEAQKVEIIVSVSVGAVSGADPHLPYKQYFYDAICIGAALCATNRSGGGFRETGSGEDSQSCSSKLLGERNSIFTDDIGMVKGKGPPVPKELSILGGQLRSKALSFYKEREGLVRKGVGEVSSIRGNIKNWQRKVITSKFPGSKPDVFDSETRPSE
ncbi:1268_t:CDS:2, partial [Racocetra fulgida]